jgi:hypothetical protein
VDKAIHHNKYVKSFNYIKVLLIADILNYRGNGNEVIYNSTVNVTVSCDIAQTSQAL